MLMDIILYLLLFIQYQHKQICWLFNFICRYIPLKQWAFDDSIHPNIKNFGLTSFQRSFITRNGITKTTFLTSNGSMARKSNLSAAVLNVILMTTVPVHVAMLQSLISTRIMVQKDRSCAKYAPPHSLRKKTVFQSPTPSNAHTAITRWLIRKTANTLLSTNA